MASGKELMALLPRLSDLVKREEIQVNKLIADAIRTKGVKKILTELERELKGLNDIAMDVLSSLAW